MLRAVRPRVGHIDFLNCLPLYHGLVRYGAVLDMALHRGTPTELNRMLLAGDLDISPISSVEYLRNASDLLLLPDLTVAADGPVGSIALASRVPAEELGGRTVALTHTSATSQALTRIILQERYGVSPRYVERPPDLWRMLDVADAGLLIGDPALRVLWQRPAGLHVYDLGEEWTAHTGHAMVFAVWAVQREYAARFPELVAAVLDGFRHSLRYSLDHVDEIAAAAARWEAFPAEVLASYFRTLRFELTDRFRQGLAEFARRAVAHGLLNEAPRFEFVSEVEIRVAA
jgi:chorismate dehydratase